MTTTYSNSKYHLTVSRRKDYDIIKFFDFKKSLTQPILYLESSVDSMTTLFIETCRQIMSNEK